MDILAKIEEIKRKREELERELLSLPANLYEAKYDEYWQKEVLLEKEEYKLKDTLLTDEIREEKRRRIQELENEMKDVQAEKKTVSEEDYKTLLYYIDKYSLLIEEKEELEWDLMSEEERDLKRKAALHLGKKMD